MLVAACGSDSDDALDEENAEYKGKSAEALYQEARQAFNDKNYKQAAEIFDEVDRQHPYSEWAKRSQVMAGFAHYKRQEYDDAILTFEQFVKLHPGNENVAYAYYMIALCYYEQISDVGRDQGMTEKALASLNEVIRRFPESQYARDAKLKLDLTYDHLAGKEMMVGRYYQDRGELLPAANRFRYVIENYETTSHTAEALHRLVETYMALGVKEEAKRYGAVLGHNFPASKWYRYSYRLINEGASLPESKEDESWLGIF